MASRELVGGLTKRIKRSPTPLDAARRQTTQKSCFFLSRQSLITLSRIHHALVGRARKPAQLIQTS